MQTDLSPLERWLPVVGAEARYEVSSLGRVRRIVGGQGVRPPHVTSGSVDTLGYLGVNIGLGTKASNRSRRVHRLVAEAFLGASNGREVNHIDGNRANNRAENLEWVDAKGNRRHARDVLDRWKGAANHAAKLTPEAVVEIRSLRYKVSEYELARRFGVSRSAIAHVQQGDRWHL